ncbi:hypothetical protein CS022_21410 [Veronia nyctiphanis]|uniref:Transglycosylase SLT domain-containing protein n=1 Tax=Veronia nyctiphanis TaxID=1278244 RepID=A0A4Q0YLB7_9GAMM|nr:transglycosylase SLT domain-containing protein [Veronia nyctiphanis]RXJ71223.1 hypothetical protein CS022_21410 [Veronia nyctiphanis]
MRDNLPVVTFILFLSLFLPLGCKNTALSNAEDVPVPVTEYPDNSNSLSVTLRFHALDAEQMLAELRDLECLLVTAYQAMLTGTLNDQQRQALVNLPAITDSSEAGDGAIPANIRETLTTLLSPFPPREPRELHPEWAAETCHLFRRPIPGLYPSDDADNARTDSDDPNQVPVLTLLGLGEIAFTLSDWETMDYPGRSLFFPLASLAPAMAEQEKGLLSRERLPAGSDIIDRARHEERQRLLSALFRQFQALFARKPVCLIPECDEAARLQQWLPLFEQHSSTIFPTHWLAAQAFTESTLNPEAVSSAGAVGLMQLMPETARDMGVRDIWSPQDNVRGGAKYNQWLYRHYWKRLPANQARAFTLASYNAGIGHVLDARRLAARDGQDPDKWFSEYGQKGVEDYIVQLSQKAIYQLPIVRYGYCRGEETKHYVRQVFHKAAEYRQQDN